MDGTAPREELIVIKAEHDGTLRRFSVDPKCCRFSDLLAILCELYGQVAENMSLCYRDDEDDWVTLSADADWQEAVLFARSLPARPPVLRMRISTQDPARMSVSGASEASWVREIPREEEEERESEVPVEVDQCSDRVVGDEGSTEQEKESEDATTTATSPTTTEAQVLVTEPAHDAPARPAAVEPAQECEPADQREMAPAPEPAVQEKQEESRASLFEYLINEGHYHRLIVQTAVQHSFNAVREGLMGTTAEVDVLVSAAVQECVRNWRDNIAELPLEQDVVGSVVLQLRACGAYSEQVITQVRNKLMYELSNLFRNLRSRYYANQQAWEVATPSAASAPPKKAPAKLPMADPKGFCRLNGLQTLGSGSTSSTTSSSSQTPPTSPSKAAGTQAGSSRVVISAEKQSQAVVSIPACGASTQAGGSRLTPPLSVQTQASTVTNDSSAQVEADTESCCTQAGVPQLTPPSSVQTQAAVITTDSGAQAVEDTEECSSQATPDVDTHGVLAGISTFAIKSNSESRSDDEFVVVVRDQDARPCEEDEEESGSVNEDGMSRVVFPDVESLASTSTVSPAVAVRASDANSSNTEPGANEAAVAQEEGSDLVAPPPSMFEYKLACLKGMGFADEELNANVLVDCNEDLNLALSALLAP